MSDATTARCTDNEWAVGVMGSHEGARTHSDWSLRRYDINANDLRDLLRSKPVRAWRDILVNGWNPNFDMWVSAWGDSVFSQPAALRRLREAMEG